MKKVKVVKVPVNKRKRRYLLIAKDSKGQQIAFDVDTAGK